MIYVGIDMHKSFLQVAAVSGGGTLLLNERVGSDHDSVTGFFMSPRFTKRQMESMRCVMESSSVWYGLFRYMTGKLGLDVVLSNPYQTKAIAASKKKTDKVDAVMLADLLRGGYIAESHVPDEDTVGDRRLVRHRKALVDSRTRYKNMIHGILLQEGIRMQGGAFGKANTGRLRGMGDYRIDGYLDIIGAYDGRIRDADAAVGGRADALRAASLLRSIPGIGSYTALVVAAEIGDISRFADSHRLCSYAGIVPSMRSSADTIHHGRITRTGSRILRWALVEAVHTHVRYAPDSDISASCLFSESIQYITRSILEAAATAAFDLPRFFATRRESIARYGQGVSGLHEIVDQVSICAISKLIRPQSKTSQGQEW